MPSGQVEWAWSEGLSGVAFADWDALLARAARPSPFLSRLFLVPWAEAFAAKDRLVRVGIFRNRGVPAGLIFLCRSVPAKGWTLLGGEDVSDSLDAVVAETEAQAFWEAFLRAAKPLFAEGAVRLPNLVEGSPALSILPPLCREAGLACSIEETDRSPFVPLPADFGEYLAGLGAKSRHELRRKIRRAEAAVSGLRFRVTENEGDLARDMSSFIRLHRLSHPDKRNFMDERMAAFFRRVGRAFFEAGRLRLAFLCGAQGDIAAAFQIEWNETLLLYNSGFDPACRSASPGLVLVARCIEEAVARGLREYDFLRGTERYKYDLGARDRLVFRVTIRKP